jgi:hypothetical protein
MNNTSRQSRNRLAIRGPSSYELDVQTLSLDESIALTVRQPLKKPPQNLAFWMLVGRRDSGEVTSTNSRLFGQVVADDVPIPPMPQLADIRASSWRFGSSERDSRLPCSLQILLSGYHHR